MVTIKEFATQNNVTYESIRKQIKRYQKELQEHIHKVGNTQFLDDEAVAFLEKKRKNNPVIIQEKSKDEEIQRLEKENKMLLIKVAQLQDALIKEKDSVKLLQQEKIELLERDIQPVVLPQAEKKSFLERIFKK